MSKEHKRDLVSSALISAIPLFGGASGVKQALFLCGAVLLSVFIFELLFFLTRYFWMRAVRELLALVLLATVLEGIFLMGKSFSWWGIENIGPVFLPTLVSAFLLSKPAASILGEPFAKRICRLAIFLIFVLMIGATREWDGSFKVFPPGPFWVSGAALAFILLMNRKAHP